MIIHHCPLFAGLLLMLDRNAVVRRVFQSMCALQIVRDDRKPIVIRKNTLQEPCHSAAQIRSIAVQLAKMADQPRFGHARLGR